MLASFRIEDATSAILSSRITPTLGPPRLTPKQAIALAGRSSALRDWIGQYPGVQPVATLGDDRVWTISYDARSGTRWPRPGSTTRR